MSFGYEEELGKRWAAGDKKARKEVDIALNKAGMTIDDVTAKTLERKLDSLNGLTACSRASRRDETMRSGKSTVIARRSAAPCVNRSRKSRTQSSETSRRAK